MFKCWVYVTEDLLADSRSQCSGSSRNNIFPLTPCSSSPVVKSKRAFSSKIAILTISIDYHWNCLLSIAILLVSTGRVGLNSMFSLVWERNEHWFSQVTCLNAPIHSHFRREFSKKLLKSLKLSYFFKLNFLGNFIKLTKWL